MDVHKEMITLATAEGPGDGEVREYGTIANSLHALERALRNIQKPDVTLHCVYEAGPCGFVIYRRLQQLKIECRVIAPSLTPRKPGERIKTDRRDARKLARLHRAGELTAIHVPDERDEVHRLQHYSIHTERSYVDWIKRFVRFHQMKSRADLTEGERKIEVFLTPAHSRLYLFLW